ncbi:MAG: zf-HC2 domain-containing protein [Syntrophomonas sp.]
MGCPDQGKLLLYMDKELTEHEMLQTELHLKTCPDCRLVLQDLHLDLELARNLIGPWQKQAEMAPVPDNRQAWDSINRQVLVRKRGNKYMKIKKWAVACSLVLAFGMVLTVPSLRAAAGNLLQVFRVDKVSSISLSQDEMKQISEAIKSGDPNIDFNNYGKFESIGQQSSSELTAEQVKALAFAVKLPEGAWDAQNKLTLDKFPEMRVTPKVEKINQLLTALGSTELMPASLDGKTFAIKTNDMVTLRTPGYILSQGLAPTVDAPDDVDVNRLVQAMLAVPIWPENVERQMRAIDDWQHTLVVPGADAKKVDINGVPGVLSQADGISQLVWQDQGILFLMVNQPGSSTDILQAARSMR